MEGGGSDSAALRDTRRSARGVVVSLLLRLLLAEGYLFEWVAAGAVLGFNYGVSSRVDTTLRATPEVRRGLRAFGFRATRAHARRGASARARARDARTRDAQRLHAHTHGARRRRPPSQLTRSSFPLAPQQALASGVVRDAELLYPTTEGTISGSLLFGLSFGLPAALTLFCNLLAAPLPGGRFGAASLARGVRDVHHLMLTILQAYALASTWKIWLNEGVGRERPDWYARVALATSADTTAAEAKKLLAEGRASYPSGHAAYSHTSGAACFWYLASRMRIFRAGGDDAPTRFAFAALMLAVAPVGLATYIGTTRLTDYRHHFSDVNAGTFIGIVAGTLCYALNFRLPGSADEAAHDDAARARTPRGRWGAGGGGQVAAGREAKEEEQELSSPPQVVVRCSDGGAEDSAAADAASA
jgi:membrane-associated phospholipid phosphatase